PWIAVADNYKSINAEKARSTENSIFHYYQKLIQLRKENDILTFGDYELLTPEDEQIFAYLRQWNGESLLVINNFYGSETSFSLPENLQLKGKKEVMISNYNDVSQNLENVKLRPYESVVYHITQV
ncbi:MAG: alpha-glucosidase C-terminal domain-containing protein, partial [Halobacillus sp.]